MQTLLPYMQNTQFSAFRHYFRTLRSLCANTTTIQYVYTLLQYTLLVHATLLLSYTVYTNAVLVYPKVRANMWNTLCMQTLLQLLLQCWSRS
jgi:hypothetical protein